MAEMTLTIHHESGLHARPLAQFVKSEAVRLARLIKDANIKVD